MTFLEQYTFIPLLRELKMARRGDECPSLEAVINQFIPVPPTSLFL
jgi:hypothetical protein